MFRTKKNGQIYGFRINCIDFDYFSKHYEEEIIENDIVCRDIIRLTMDYARGINDGRST
ncbi:hypothetical protein [Bacillus manliponensis]|uniref:hypothetical protein n=1 Tax=Bacillus manliponensis TaxID=574376 RepID=UPI000AEFADF1|nr:hypothetical protein [Bacillus manliponensis]